MNTHQRTLEFDVKQQRLTRSRDCDFSGLVAGSVGYLRAKFNFSLTEWFGLKKAASFWTDEGKEYAVLLDRDDSCLIPHEVLTEGRFYVSVMGAKANYKIETSKVKVNQEVH